MSRRYYFATNYLKRKLIWPVLEILWRINSKPVPVPHSIKVNEILKVSKSGNIKVFIETGTFLGHTIEAVKNDFDHIYSIELDKQLAVKARLLFQDYKNIKIITGDSSKELPKLIKKLKEPVLFWLDAHYSGGVTARGDIDTPIIQELKVILDSKVDGHIILIDDAREFVGNNGYPTIKVLKRIIKTKKKDANVKVVNDMIIIT